MQLVTSILGNANDPAFRGELHRLDHDGLVEWLVIPRAELARRRLRASTDKGREIAVALSRDLSLFDNAILVLRDDLAVVLRVEAENWLRIRPRDSASALALGYHAGNLHWRVRFDGDLLLVALDGPCSRYIDRLSAFMDDGRITLEEAPAGLREERA